MKMIDEFEARHMSQVQFVLECWEREFTYQDYCTNAELLNRVPVGKAQFNVYYGQFSYEQAKLNAERKRYADLGITR